MIKLDEQSLNFVAGGAPNNNNNNNNYIPEKIFGDKAEEFLKGLRKFPKKSYKTVSHIITGKNPKKYCNYTPNYRTGEAAGMVIMAMTVIGLWETTKLAIK